MTVGIICEYNPFHNGHIYHIKKAKELFPHSTLVLALNGYFLERGEISCLTKETKVKLALLYGVDLVLELPLLYGTQSADKFAECGIQLLDAVGCDTILFGSESCDEAFLRRLAARQLEEDFAFQSKNGENYPASLNRSLQEENKISPNDLLGISYLKAILKFHSKMGVTLIKRTNSYHDIVSCNSIVSASNIREKWKQKEDISPYLPSLANEKMVTCNETLLFSFLKYKILTEKDLTIYLDVVEGLDFKLRHIISSCESFKDLLFQLKSKRYTYNRLRRMLIHILLSIKVEDANTPLSYIRVLGFNSKGQAYLKEKKKDIPLPLKIDYDSPIYKIEILASQIYDLLTLENTYLFERKNQPIGLNSVNDSSQK